MRSEIVTFGSCYVDMNAWNMPFGEGGIPANVEIIGNEYEVLGGGSAVNFCRMVGKLGMAPNFVGSVGADPMGRLLEMMLKEENIQANLYQHEGKQTNITFGMTGSKGDHIQCVAGTANQATAAESALPTLEAALENADYLYLGGVFKLKGLMHSLQDIADLAFDMDVRLIVDHGRIPEATTHEEEELVRELVKRADYYFPSKDEFVGLWNVMNIEDGLAWVRQQAPRLTTIVKNGPEGAVYLEGDAVRYVKVERVITGGNVTGAGDSFNAGVVSCIASGRSVHEAVSYGCAVAAAKISHQQPPLLEEQ